MKFNPEIRHEYLPNTAALVACYMTILPDRDCIYRTDEILSGVLYVDNAYDNVVKGIEIIDFVDFDVIAHTLVERYYAWPTSPERITAWLRANWPRQEAWELK